MTWWNGYDLSAGESMNTLDAAKRDILVLIALECGGAADYGWLRDFYRKIDQRLLVDCLGLLLQDGMIVATADGDKTMWRLTEAGIVESDRLIRTRAARDLLPLDDSSIRLLRYLIKCHGREFIATAALERVAVGGAILKADLAGGVVLLHRRLLEFDKAMNGVRVSILGRFALELTETMTGRPFYADPCPYVKTFAEMMAQYPVRA